MNTMMVDFFFAPDKEGGYRADFREGDDVMSLVVKRNTLRGWKEAWEEKLRSLNSTEQKNLLDKLLRIDLKSLPPEEAYALTKALWGLSFSENKTFPWQDALRKECSSLITGMILRHPSQYLSFYLEDPEPVFYWRVVADAQAGANDETFLIWSRQGVQDPEVKARPASFLKHLLILALCSSQEKEQQRYLKQLTEIMDPDDPLLIELDAMLAWYDQHFLVTHAKITFHWLLLRYYLRRYELRRAIEKTPQGSGRFHRGFAFFVHRVEQIGMVMAAYSATVIGMLKVFASTQRGGICLSTLILLPILAMLLLGTVLLRELFQGSEYISLDIFFPKLAGAVLVGLSVMAITPESWWIPFNLPPINLVSVSLLALVLSYFFLFVKIHRVYADNYLTLQTDGGDLRRRIAIITWKIFLIGLIIAAFLSFFVSGLFYPMLYRLDEAGETGRFLNELLVQGQGSVMFCCPNGPLAVAFGFFPRLLALWTSMGLFIGTFVQLLWEDYLLAE